MGLFGVYPRTCERAREWASLRLDGELSDFERVHLRAHLTRCASCSDYVAQVTEATETLRDAPLVPFAAAVALPARHRPLVGLRVYRAAGAVAVLVAAVGFGSILGTRGVRPETPAGSPSAAISRETVAEDTLIRGPRLAMINAEKGLGTQRGIGIADI